MVVKTHRLLLVMAVISAQARAAARTAETMT